MQVEFLILEYEPKKLVSGSAIAVAYRRLAHAEDIRCCMAEGWAKTVTRGHQKFIKATLDQFQSEDVGLRFELWESLAEADHGLLLTRERGICE